jgi:hypothetical protein
MSKAWRRLARDRLSVLCACALSCYVFAVGVNLAASALVHRPDTPAALDADEREYYDLASALLDGSYRYDARRTLGHVVLVAAIRKLFGDSVATLQTVVSLLFAATAPLFFLVARRTFGVEARGAAREQSSDRIAWAAGLTAAAWPPLVYFGGTTLYSEATACPFFAAFLLALPLGGALTQGGGAASLTRWLGAGALLGLCMHIRPMYLLFAPFAVLIVWWEERSKARAVRQVLALVAGCCLVVLPWSAYASSQAGRPLLLSANSGETLGGGLNPKLMETGYSVYRTPDGRVAWTGRGKWVPMGQTGYLNEAELELPTGQRDALMRERTLRWISAHPADALRLEGAKLEYMWGFGPAAQWASPKQALLGNVPTLLMLGLALFGLARHRGDWRRLARFWTLPLFVSGVAMVSWGSWRFRGPGDLGCIALGELGLFSLLAPYVRDLLARRTAPSAALADPDAQAPIRPVKPGSSDAPVQPSVE